MSGLPSPPAFVPGSAGATALVAGRWFTCVVLAAGGVRCWGDDRQGDLGDEPTDSTGPTPVVVTEITGATQLTAGNERVCADQLGSVWCWGSNYAGAKTRAPPP